MDADPYAGVLALQMSLPYLWPEAHLSFAARLTSNRCSAWMLVASTVMCCVDQLYQFETHRPIFPWSSLDTMQNPVGNVSSGARSAAQQSAQKWSVIRNMRRSGCLTPMKGRSVSSAMVGYMRC